MSTTVKRHVVAGVDGSACALDAARWAARRAVDHHADLLLVMAYDISVGLAGSEAFFSSDAYADVQQWAEDALDGVADRIQQEFPALAVSSELRRGHPVRVLATATEFALMTVVGARGASPLTDLLIGSVAARLAAHGRGPVAVIREVMADHPGHPIWVGVDGIEQDEAALAFAFEEASVQGVDLVALRCWGEDPGSVEGPYYPLEKSSRRREQEQHQQLGEQLAGWRAKYPDVDVAPILLRGYASTAMLHRYHDVALDERPSLIVLGSRARGPITRLFMGSTSREVLAHAPCPVAVVRSGSVGR